MGTPLQKVYDAFLAKVEADEWMMGEYWEEVKKDWKMILDAAIASFRYPRVSLEYDEESETFNDILSNDEIQVLSNLMKREWVRRCVATWDNIRQLYSNKDFSQANHLDKLNKTAAQVETDCINLLDKYGRSQNYRPNAKFGQLAGK